MAKRGQVGGAGIDQNDGDVEYVMLSTKINKMTHGSPNANSGDKGYYGLIQRLSKDWTLMEDEATYHLSSTSSYCVVCASNSDVTESRADNVLP